MYNKLSLNILKTVILAFLMNKIKLTAFLKLFNYVFTIEVSIKQSKCKK